MGALELNVSHSILSAGQLLAFVLRVRTRYLTLVRRQTDASYIVHESSSEVSRSRGELTAR